MAIKRTKLYKLYTQLYKYGEGQVWHAMLTAARRTDPNRKSSISEDVETCRWRTASSLCSQPRFDMLLNWQLGWGSAQRLFLFSYLTGTLWSFLVHKHSLCLHSAFLVKNMSCESLSSDKGIKCVSFLIKYVQSPVKGISNLMLRRDHPIPP